MAQSLVVIDDTNPNIQYSGPWFLAQDTQLDTGDFGPPFLNTLHGVNVSASFSYSFSGSSVTVFGTSITTSASGTQDPTWECFVDNNSIGWNTVLSSYPENNWIFCENSQLQDGPHVLSVNATVSNQQTFWFDQIQYVPSSNSQLDQSMLHIDSSNSAVQYSSGQWMALDSIVNLTQNTGATVTYDFSGVSLSWYGFNAPNFPLIASSAAYSIDGQTPTSFLVPTGEPVLYNQLYFSTEQLSAGLHQLVVTYQGHSGTAPLTLDFLVVQDAPSSSSTSSATSHVPTLSPSFNSPVGTLTSTSTTSPTSSSSNTLSSYISYGATATTSGIPSSSSGSSSNSTANLGPIYSSTATKSVRNLGAIIGGVFGGLIFLILLLLFLLLFFRKRSNQGERRVSEKSSLSDSHNVVDPFTVPPTTTTWHSPRTLSNDHAQSNYTPSIFGSLGPTSPLTEYPSPGSGIPTLLPVRHHPSSSVSSPSAYSQFSLPHTVVQTNSIDGAMTKARETEMTQAQRLSVPESDDATFLRHEDSGIRMPRAESNLVELPPLYTPG